MRRQGLTLASFVLLAAALAAVMGACFSPHQPACSFACGPDEACPESYVCMSDGLCHRVDSQEPCSSVAGQPRSDAGAD